MIANPWKAQYSARMIIVHASESIHRNPIHITVKPGIFHCKSSKIMLESYGVL